MIRHTPQFGGARFSQFLATRSTGAEGTDGQEKCPLKKQELQLPCLEEFAGEGTVWDASLPVSLVRLYVVHPNFHSPKIWFAEMPPEKNNCSSEGGGGAGARGGAGGVCVCVCGWLVGGPPS